MRKKLSTIVGLLLTATLVAACSHGGSTMNKNTIFPKGDRAPSQVFTNTTWVKMLHTDEGGGFDAQVYNVTFEPAARTFWHSHPGGQILLCTNGQGYYQEKDKPAQLLNPGDVVAIPSNVVHWHGAAPDSEFVHLGMSTQVRLGPAEWFGPVTDEEYRAASTK